jgi:NADH dehydrogenase/NADH:ubiquinone oxidoreductase subunit G
MISGRGRVALRSKSKMKILTFSMACFASVIHADDFKTNGGKEYKNVTVSRVEPDGIVLITSVGISKVYFTELPKEVQERFHYDTAKAAAYSAEQAANYAAYQKQQEGAQHQREEVAAKKKAVSVQQEAANNRIQALQDRYAALQKEENALLLRIGEAKQPGPAYWGGKYNRTLLHYPNPQASQLSLLQSHLNDLRREKNDTKKQLERAQR